MNQENNPISIRIILDSSQINDLARPLRVIIEAFYSNPENEKRFQVWQNIQEQNKRDEKKSD